MAAELGGAVVSGVASKIAESAFDSIGQRISYLFKYQSYIDDLKNQVQDLESARERVKHQVDEAERRGEEIEQDVVQWLEKVNEFTEGVVKPIIGDEDKVRKRCFIGLCPNLIQRYTLGKKAAKALPGGIDLSGKGDFSSVSYRPPIQRTESVYIRGYEAFDSRMPVLQEIMEALKDANVDMVGVHGMAGVGKTTLVKKVASQTKEEKLFDVVVMTTVTQTPDFKKIQEEIADHLGLRFLEQSVSGRSLRLRDRLKREKRILVILDDIWAKLDLDAVGIPYGDIHEGIGQEKDVWKDKKDDERRFKILLTSRDQLVLRNHMNIQNNFLVDLLSNEEAWYLFRKIVDDSVETSDFRPITAEIIEKCAGLPLAITTIANALKGKSVSVWRDALRQLKSYNPRCVPEMNNTLYSTIELSYKLLNDEEAKKLLLLCALFNNEHVSFFLTWAMGLGLFENVNTISDGRNRLKSMIDYLEASCLLLKGNNNEKVKMHDVIQIVVASIAKEKRMFNIQDANKEVLVKGMYKDSIFAISLLHRDIDGLPERVKFPNLELFTLYLKKDHCLQIPNHFFEGMKELKVLELSDVRLLPLPSSFSCLTNLQTLHLLHCTLGDITMIGELRNLKILCFVSCEFEQVPESFRQLTQLRFLQLSNCSKLRVITPNVIASLSRLEELYIYNSFDRWDFEGRNNASLAELKGLSQLNTLCIQIPNLQIIQQDFIPENLEKYNVHIGDAWEWSYEYETSRKLRLKFNGSLHLKYGIELLVERAEYLYLDHLDGVKDILWELDREGFPQLKHLSVQNSSKILYIVNSMGRIIPSNDAFPILESLFLINLSNMEKICCGLVDAKSFSKLRIIKVEKCDRLRYLFSSSMAKNVSQIQEIEVTDCKELKEIFCQESADHVDENERNCKVEFKQLHSLVLQCLPQFISFGLKVVLPGLENLKLSSIKIQDIYIWIDRPQPMFSSFQSLKSLTMEECNGLKFLFSSSMVKSFMQLQKLVICNCKSMEAVILDSEGLEVQDKIIDMSFPKLFYLKLVGLPKLTRFGTGNSVKFPSLIELHIESCSNLKTFFPNFSGVDMLRKEPEEVSLEDYIIDVNPLFDDKVAFPNLEKMTLSHLDNLQLIWHNQLHGDSFCRLKKVIVKFCEKLMTIVPSNISTQGLLTFHNLETLIVNSCWNMKSLFPVSIATGLVKVKQLAMISCGLEEIVTKDEVDEAPRFLFPQLTLLELNVLPNLKGFYLGSHTTEWPMLKQLHVYHCGKIKVYASDGESQPGLFLFEKVIPNLEMWGLDADNITSTCLDRIPARHFRKLKHFGLVNCDNESLSFWCSILKKLDHLETLYLGNGTLQELDYQVGTFLQNLQTLKVDRCHLLKYLMPSSAISFKKLKSLEVDRCNGLTNILACSAARTLVHLTTVRIRGCKLVTEVIATEVEITEEEIVFSQLKILELHCLSSLTSFCSANCAFEFPCLEQVIVSQCPKLKIFTQGSLSTPKLNRVQPTEEINGEYVWKEDLNYTIQQMFIDMVGFRNYEHLKLSEFPTLGERFWNAKVLASSLFCNLKLLVLDMCLDSSTAIPFNVLCNLKNLETLEIRSCDSLKEVFDMQGQLNGDGHTLKKSHQEVLDFNNLKSFKAHNCCSLRHIFTPSIILGLVQLQEIEVKNCALIEEIILNEAETEADVDKIMIPQLNSIILESLPNLTSFYSGMKTLECPALKAIIVAKCPQIETFVFTDMKHQSDHIAPLFSEKVAFPSLEKMILLHLDNLQLIWHNQLHEDSFSKLKEVRVEFCEKLMTIVPSNSTQGFLTFYNLETLNVKNCWNMKSMFPVSIATSLLQLKVFMMDSCGLEEFVVNEEVDEAPKFLFPQLDSLHLLRLPEVKHFYRGRHTIECPMLKSLTVYRCGKIKIFASEFSKVQNTDQESQPSIGLSEKGMPNLESLCLSFDAFRLICHNHFPLEGLKGLLLGELHDESIPFSYDFLKRLFILEKLILIESSSKELFPFEKDTWKEDYSQVHSFLPNLRTLEVSRYYHLTQLWASLVSFTNLTTLDIEDCNGLVNIFTCSTVRSLVQLTEIRIRECELLEEVITGEFDQTEEEIIFCRLKTLDFHCLASLTCFCSVNYAFKFPCLEQIIVSECPKLTIFTQGSLSIPKLNKVQQRLGTIEEYVWKDNLNSTLQYISEKYLYPNSSYFLYQHCY